MTHQAPDVCVIKLSGEIDQPAYVQLSDFINGNFRSSETAVLVDMEELRFMDSSGIKFLHHLAARFGYENVAVRAMNADLKRILSFVGLDQKLAHLNNFEEIRTWRSGSGRAA